MLCTVLLITVWVSNIPLGSRIGDMLIIGSLPKSVSILETSKPLPRSISLRRVNAIFMSPWVFVFASYYVLT